MAFHLLLLVLPDMRRMLAPLVFAQIRFYRFPPVISIFAIWLHFSVSQNQPHFADVNILHFIIWLSFMAREAAFPYNQQ